MNIKINENSGNDITDWDDYSQSFQSVMPSEMLNLNRSVADYMHGHVADFGCGAGKIIPFILQNDDVHSYTGIDSSVEMISRARWMASKFTTNRATLVHAYIEDAKIEPVDSALSINSHYTWPDPHNTLEVIYNTIKPGGTFVLATINNSLNMPALLEAASLEMVAHPHWEAFKNHNLGICTNDNINLMDLDALIGQVREVGFKVEEAQRRWYDNGLNLLVLKKP